MNKITVFYLTPNNSMPLIRARGFDDFGYAVDPLYSPIRIKALFFENQLNTPLAVYKPQKVIGAMSRPM